jgi:hypothetical protein
MRSSQRLELSVALTAVLTACLSVNAEAQERCGLRPSLMTSGFERGEQPILVSLPAPTTPLSLAVDFPLEGQTINGSQLQVFGSYTGPANTGITINGTRYAVTDGSQFTFGKFSLPNGPQTFTVSATTVDGVTATVVRNVIISASAKDNVTLTAASRGGFAPFRTEFSLTTSPPVGQTNVTRFEIDLDGNGVFEFDGGSVPALLTSEYPSAGIYLAKARVTFDDGQATTPVAVRQAQFRIHVESVAFTRLTLCSVYYDMKHRLQAGQITSAGALLSTKIRSRFVTAWNLQSTTISTTASRLGEITNGQLSNVSANFQVALPIAGSLGLFRGFPLLFARGADGVWRISGM